MTILYKVHNNLYVNLTNKCPCSCTFCLRQTMDHVGESDSLWLTREPEYDEIIADFANFDVASFDELVFCGFGEPTERIDVLLKVARYFKETYHKPIRINTNGQGSLIAGRDISGELAECVDVVSISLNDPNPVKYQQLVRSKFGDQAFPGMIDFAKKCVAKGLKVVMTTVDTTITHEEEQACGRICQEIGATYRIRPWED